MLVPNHREQGQALCRPVCQPSSAPKQQELGSPRPQHPCLSTSQYIAGTQMAKDMDGWSGKGRTWERRGQYCDLGGPICPPEEEFGQLYGHPRAAGRALNVDGKVGSGVWAQSVPRSCDWRKAAGVLSPIKDQVPAPSQPGSVQPQWWKGEERGKAWTPDLAPAPLPIRKAANAAGP